MNAALAYAVLDQITAHPQTWDQSFWITETDCGTAACFAGWACLLSGDRPSHEQGVLELGRSRMLFRHIDFVEVDGSILPNPVRYRAADLLGIGYGDAHALFASSNTIDQLHQLVTRIFGPHPLPNVATSETIRECLELCPA